MMKSLYLALLLLRKSSCQEPEVGACKGKNFKKCDGPRGETTPKDKFFEGIIPSDGNLDNLDSSELRKKLTQLLKSTYKRVDYDDCGYIALEKIDQSDSDSVTAFYSQKSIKKENCVTVRDGKNIGGNDNWNREHIYPAGNWKRNEKFDAYHDLHHLVAADFSINQERDNYDFKDLDGDEESESSDDLTCRWCKKNTQKLYWEPAGDEQKGRIARMLFYMDIRNSDASEDSADLELELVDGSSNPPGVDGKIKFVANNQLGDRKTLWKWHCLSAVKDVERRRNDSVEKWQGNRNPFIDYPQLVEKLYGFDCNDIGTTPNKVQIVSAEVNPDGDDTGNESVTIQNNSDEEVDLAGWTIAGDNDNTSRLCVLSPGDTFKIANLGKSGSAQLTNKSRKKITLYDSDATKQAVLDEVIYESAGAIVSVFRRTNRAPQPNKLSIIQAEVNPEGDDSGNESVTIQNNSEEDFDLGELAIAGDNGNTSRLCVLSPGDTFKIDNLGKSGSAQLTNKSGKKITLFDDEKNEVDKVTYESATADVSFRRGEL